MGSGNTTDTFSKLFCKLQMFRRILTSSTHILKLCYVKNIKKKLKFSLVVCHFDFTLFCRLFLKFIKILLTFYSWINFFIWNKKYQEL